MPAAGSTPAFCNDYNTRGVTSGMFIKVKDEQTANGIADAAELEN